MPWITVTQQPLKYVCDCPTPAEPSTSCYRCTLCEKDLCRNCVYRYDFDNTAYCPRCWTVGKPYRLQIEDAQGQYAATVEALERAWREAVRKETSS